MSQAFLVPALDFADTAGTPWNPGTLVPGPLQRFLDEDPTYYGSTVAGRPVFTPEESYTSIAQPRSGRCWLFDGSNDFATRGARLTSGTVSALTVAFWFKHTTTTGTLQLLGEFVPGSLGRAWAIRTSNTNLALFTSTNGDATTNLLPIASTVHNNGAWHHGVLVYSAGSVKFHLDGVLVTNTTIADTALYNTASAFTIGAVPDGTAAWGGSLKDVIVEQAAWSDAEVLSLYNTHTVPAGKSPLAFYRCEEESGTTGYNSLSNSNHLTLTNITQSTFHALDTGVRYSDANERGHTVANNLLQRSEEFDNAAWTKNSGQGTVTANADGIGDMFTESTNSHIQGLYQAVTVVSGAVYTIGVDLKYGTRRYVRLAFGTGGGTDSVYADVDLQSGTIVNQGPYGGATQPVAPTIVANGSYYRITLTGSIPSTTGYVTIYGRSSSANSNPESAIGYTGNSSTWYMNRAQTQPGSVATPYVATTSSTFTNVIIPRSVATPTQDVAGNTLGVTGPVAKLATAEVRCVTGDGVNAYAVSGSNIGITGAANRTVCFRAKLNSTGFQTLLAFGDNAVTGSKFQLTAWSNNGFSLDANSTGVTIGPGSRVDTSWHSHAVTYNGTTFRWYIDGVEIGSGTVTLNTTNTVLTVLAKPIGLGSGDQSAASIGDIRIYSDVKTLAEIQAVNNGTDNRTNLLAHYPCQEGPGTANTNRTIYDTVDTNHLTLVNGTVSAIWANYCPYARDWCIENGGGVAANGAFIPGRIGTGLDAAGSTKTLVAGKHGNPYSRIAPNIFNMPSLVIRGVDSADRLAPSTTYESLTTATDDAFNRIRSDGSDRYFVTPATLTGDDLTNADAYTT